MPFNSFDDYPMNWRPDRESLGKPYYVGLVDLLEESVRAGELPAGAALPPQRELADFLDLNPSTVARAYALARERGLVYGVTGKGTFVAPHAQSDLTITAEGADGLVELGMVTGFNQWPTPCGRWRSAATCRGSWTIRTPAAIRTTWRRDAGGWRGRAFGASPTAWW